MPPLVPSSGRTCIYQWTAQQQLCVLEIYSNTCHSFKLSTHPGSEILNMMPSVNCEWESVGQALCACVGPPLVTFASFLQTALLTDEMSVFNKIQYHIGQHVQSATISLFLKWHFQNVQLQLHKSYKHHQKPKQTTKFQTGTQHS